MVAVEYRRIDGHVAWVRDPHAPRIPLAAISAPRAVADFAAPRLAGLLRECVYILGLDTKNHPVCWSLVGAGTADSAPAHPREVFTPLLVCGATRGILVHNHPSGDPTPSAADVHMTARMVDAGRLLGMPIVDHVIIGHDAHASIRELGLAVFD